MTVYKRTMQDLTGDVTADADWTMRSSITDTTWIGDAAGFTRQNAGGNEDQLIFDTDLGSEDIFVQMVLTLDTRSGSTIRTGPSLTRTDIAEYQSANNWIDVGTRYPRRDATSTATGVSAYSSNLGGISEPTNPVDVKMAILSDGGEVYFYQDDGLYYATDTARGTPSGGTFTVGGTNPYIPSHAGLLMRETGTQKAGMRWHHMVCGDAADFVVANNYDDYGEAATSPLLPSRHSRIAHLLRR